MTRAEEERLADALAAVVRHTQGVALSARRAGELARMLAAAEKAVEAVLPGSLFDTEPANLRAHLDGGVRGGDTAAAQGSLPPGPGRRTGSGVE